ncbi:Peptidoglycan O-acetyltransferase [termite gut metagenome]|uniref:Peptidoglycan O-acetyltransferase n=1 Tax=termite gut metagenome TaxID=433724 RepID=A0A5J4QR01_9ZZZZ
MVVNSISFLIFFLVIFLIYYFPLKEKTKEQNVLLLLASYVFYGIADWKMIPLLLLATGVFYGLGILIGKSNETTPRKASLWTTLGVCLGVGLLVYFKYFNFFITSFSDLFASMGLKTNWSTFNIILPLGISFFTFKLISYVIEVHRQHIEPTTDIAVFATYVAFFPTIMAGPIDRPNAFIPQLQSKRAFKYDLAVDGCRQILWGMFKKMVVADNCATAVNTIWTGYQGESGSQLLLVAVLFAFQIYADFSGYSDMAIGVGKILGFRITKNFNYPFFGRNIAEYWRNWHISLTSWLTDYVFMPLNIKFRDIGKWGPILAIIITFVLIGLWHGANWTFAVFGLYHGLLYIPLMLSGSFFKKSKLKTNRYGLPTLGDASKMLLTFLLVTFGLIIFRAENIAQAWDYLCRMFSSSLFTFPDRGRSPIVYIIILLAVEWFQRDKQHALQIENVVKYRIIRWSIYSLIVLYTITNAGDQAEFIYFQF